MRAELAVRIAVATRGEVVAAVAANVVSVFVYACVVAAPIGYAPPVVLAAQVLAVINRLLFNAGHLCTRRPSDPAHTYIFARINDVN